MKKFLLILCALVCGTLAFAQTGTYTDNLHLTINGDDDGVVKSTVSIEYTDEANGIIAFTLHDFYVDVYIGEWLTIKLGDLTVYDIQLGDEVDGVAEFSCTDNSNVAYPDADPLYSMFISDVSVNMTGEVSETKLRARMDITVKILGALSYPITATFGYDYEYLVVNAQTGNYLGGGLDWGTHATELGKPQFFLFTDQLDGTYTLFGNQGGTSIGWDVDYAGLYIDAVNPLTWEIIETDGGVYIATDEGYLTGNGFQEAVTLEHSSSSSAVWKLVTKDEIIATMADASVDNPVDVTPLIPAPEPKRNDWGSSWVATGYNTSAVPDNYSLGQDYSTANCAESYHSKNGFDIRQAIPDLPTGYYTLSAQAFYRNEGGTVVPVMYIDNAQYELPVLTTNANSMEEAYQEFLRELHTITADFYVGEDDEEVTVGFTSLTTGDDGMWTIFGELGLTYTGSQPRTLQLVEGIMNVDVEAEMKAAIEAYNADPTSENFSAAQMAIAAAEESVAYYSEITDAIDSGDWEATYNGFDAAGQAAFDNGFLAAYEARTLTNESLDEGLATACKQQTTAGKDITLAMDVVDWTNATGNYQTGRERYATDNYTADEGNILYQHIDGLVAGATYEVSFYAAANSTSDRGFDNIYGDDIAQAFANELADAVTVVDQTACTIVSADNLHTFTVTVGDDAVLEYGLQNIGTGGNWYVCQAVSLIIVSVPETKEEVEGDYLVMNSGLYFGTGLVNSRQVTLLKNPMYIGFEKQDDGTYLLDSYEYNYGDGVGQHYFGRSSSVSGVCSFASTLYYWDVEEQADGTYTIYCTNSGYQGYLTAHGEQVAATLESEPSEGSYWTLITKDEFIASIPDAEKPVDVSALIDFPDFKTYCNEGYYEDETLPWPWEVLDGDIYVGVDSNIGTDVASFGNAAEAYWQTFDVCQDIVLPYAGTYTLSAQGFYRADADEYELPYLYVTANGETQEVAFPALEEDSSIASLEEAADAFYEGLYPVGTIIVEAPADNTAMRIGFKCDGDEQWTTFSQLVLLYYADEPVPEPEPEPTGTYVFVCTDWGSIDLGRVSDDNVTYDETNNTITVVASGTNNVALSNGREAPFTTADMTVTNKQCWYTVVGTNISTADGDSRLWWMNGANWGEWDPTAVVVLDDGQVLVTWDLSTMTEIDVNLLGDENYLDGWTGFGVTSTTGTSVISDINFYTTEEIDVLTGGVATSIDTVETAGTELAKEGIYTLSGVRLNKITKSGIYIVNGKKVLVK